MHLGEDPFTDWGPAADEKSVRVIHDLIGIEEPDLIVMSGDQLTANNVDANATIYYNLLADAMQDVPYAMIFGNHDDADFEKGYYPNGTIIRHHAKTSRMQLLQTDRLHHSSLTRAGPKNVFGVSNYVLPVYSRDTDSVKLQIILLDSGGGSLEQEVVQNQIDWLQSQRLVGVDAVAFQHIPTEQFRFRNQTCSGWRGQSGVSPLRRDPVGEISHLLQEDAPLHFVAVGHDHGNSYCCPVGNSSLNLCYGRHSGYGGYGEKYWQKGGRVFELKLANDDDVLTWRSWVRLESGEMVDRYDPPIDEFPTESVK